MECEFRGLSERWLEMVSLDHISTFVGGRPAPLCCCVLENDGVTCLSCLATQQFTMQECSEALAMCMCCLAMLLDSCDVLQREECSEALAMCMCCWTPVMGCKGKNAQKLWLCACAVWPCCWTPVTDCRGKCLRPFQKTLRDPHLFTTSSPSQTTYSTLTDPVADERQDSSNFPYESSKGCQKGQDVSAVSGGCRNLFMGMNYGLRVELWALLG
eukprot:1158198-Pelagomonas_calceolata.AAC.10